MQVLLKNASDIRKCWSETIDTVSRLAPYKFTATIYTEEDGSVTLSMNEIDIIENAPTLSEAKHLLAASLYEYAVEYYEEFEYWASAPNRQQHIPYIIKALLLGSDNMENDIICQNGQN